MEYAREKHKLPYQSPNMGCTFEELQKGDGQTFPKAGQTVVVHYKGWEDNIKKMSIGQKIKLTCPPEFAYGKRGFPGM
ncbi:FKB1A-like protein [Mya arenaria]|uniref:peptidylprolyl isomerase n=1 Tax=Mya arenaria TaxID=6604 RepID=A0ABY7FRX2_MYAAR|nr:FKB1A-like protein [Mya arenaria]